MKEKPTLEEDLRAIRVHLDNADHFFTAFCATIAICTVISVAMIAGLALYGRFS